MSDELLNIYIYSHYFLAQGGVSTKELIKDLGTIHLGGLEEHRQPIQDMDVEGYLEQQRTETVIKIIEDGRQEVNTIYKMHRYIFTHDFDRF